ncbi:serine/threonine-protein kinase, partial [Spirillospora sp. NPDC029432]|uniref:serine/threonine-protein kinase n=1 Tax=Spirillospora sp. NPDC029432 TaxID=3154599 RepID=UPI003455F81E
MRESGNWRIDGFTEVRELGAGAQGRVVLARHATAGTPVAIKYLSRRDGDGTEIERLREEAVMLGRVTDPHVVRLYQFVTGEHGAALVMEAVNGVSLKELLARHGALGPEAALTVLKGSLLGLAAAHEVGVVHRDYKPANVVVQGDGLSKLIDFGIAGFWGEGSRSGTPAYMAPEQWNGDPASPATDVYAATCVFFECVTGRRPYEGTALGVLREGHLSAAPPVEAVPGPLRGLVARGMAKAAGERPHGAVEFVAELEQAATAAYGPGWEQRGVRAMAGAAVALAALFPLIAAGLVPSAGVAGTAAAGTAAAGAGTAAAGGAGTAAASGAGTAAAGGAGTAAAGGAGTASGMGAGGAGAGAA